MYQIEVLGMRLYVSGYALQGALSGEEMAHVLAQVVALVGMSTGGMPPQVWAYPLLDGSGGAGETIVQPLVESFIVSDSWPDLKAADVSTPKTYVVLASCRPYNPVAVATFLSKAVGPVLRQGSFEL